MMPEPDLKNVLNIRGQITQLKSQAGVPAPMFRGSDWARETYSLHVRGYPNIVEWYIECEVNGLRVLQQSVDVDPEVRGGIPVLKGTGFTVAQTLAELAEGPGVDELAQRFNLAAENIREMLNGLSLMLQRPFPK